MRDQFLHFMLECPNAKKQVFSKNPFGNFVRSELPKALYDSGLVQKDKYLVYSSVGAGSWAFIPWVCIFDRAITTSAKKGVYIAYLLSKDSKRLYLTLNQGCTELRMKCTEKETIEKMHQNSSNIRQVIDTRGFLNDCNINLGEQLTSLGILYKEGTIVYKKYEIERFPDEVKLREDLSRMIKIYDDYACKLKQTNKNLRDH